MQKKYGDSKRLDFDNYFSLASLLQADLSKILGHPQSRFDSISASWRCDAICFQSHSCWPVEYARITSAAIALSGHHRLLQAGYAGDCRAGEVALATGGFR